MNNLRLPKIFTVVDVIDGVLIFTIDNKLVGKVDDDQLSPIILSAYTIYRSADDPPHVIYVRTMEVHRFATLLKSYPNLFIS